MPGALRSLRLPSTPTLSEPFCLNSSCVLVSVVSNNNASLLSSGIFSLRNVYVLNTFLYGWRVF